MNYRLSSYKRRCLHPKSDFELFARANRIEGELKLLQGCISPSVGLLDHLAIRTI